MASNEKYTILYGRLSQEDTQKTNKTDDSNSIQNQKLLLEKYAAEKGFTNTLFLYDDGYSGTNFNRPGWQQVMELMENGQVEILIVKDMSRLGREYLQVGQYTELIFPSYGVRFIAVNDGVDSLCESTNDFTPFRNLMNEFYAKDCSKKGRSVVRLKAETGARVSSRPRYGYMKDPADPKRHMVPDPETAPVVRYIFDLCVSGKGPAQIAKQLKKDKIPTPGYSYYQKHGVELTGVDITRPYNWSTNTVAGILEDETYLGHTINLKSTTLSFKNKKRIERPESEQLRFENTHEALVTQQTWEIVQDIRKHKRRRANMAEQNIFSGLANCQDYSAPEGSGDLLVLPIHPGSAVHIFLEGADGSREEFYSEDSWGLLGKAILLDCGQWEGRLAIQVTYEGRAAECYADPGSSTEMHTEYLSLG